MKKILIKLWLNFYPFIFVRKFFNTFKPAIWLNGLLVNVNKKIVLDADLWRTEGHYNSDFYLELDSKAQKFIDYVAQNTQSKDKVLDVCCNQGRFLLELQRNKYSALYGFDIMGSAIKKLKNHPEYLPQVINIEHTLAQEYFKNKDDDFFDWAITYTATIELINPKFDIFFELSRTVKKGMFLVINENGHAYPRFYRLLHRMHGFEICSVSQLYDKAVLIHSIKKEK